jgi:PAS domain S-box-containing protein
MKDRYKEKEQLINELKGLRQRVCDLEQSEVERKSVDDALRLSETRYRRLFEAAQDGIFILDAATGEITDANPFLTTLLGYTQEELMGKEIWEISLFRDIAANQEAFLELQKKELIRYEHLPLETKDGRQVDVEFVSNVYVVGDKKVIQCSVRDISAHKRAEEALRSAMEELGAFSNSVSHDLRAPLRAIAGFSQALSEDHSDRLDVEGKRMLNVIQDSIHDMGQLIDGLLAFSRLNHNGMKVSDINMRDLATEVFKQVRLGHPERQIRLDIQALPSAYGDRAMIREVLANLLSNAVKFTRHREEATIEVGGRTERNQTIYHVKDNGVGFDMKYVDKLFHVFQRLHSTAEFEGTGIGLALVQRIIHRHGGRVWAEGKVNEGATFYFTLPSKETNNG